MNNDVKYAVRYYFYGVPMEKHYGYRSFNTLNEAIDFTCQLDPYYVEKFDIAIVSMYKRVCISDKYCENRSVCKKCHYLREDLI